MNDNKQWHFLLGLANRARKVLSGEELVLQSIRGRQAKVVLVADDASDRTKKTLRDKCHFYDIPFLNVSDRHQLGKAIGKEQRVAVAVIEAGFAKKLISLLH